MVQEDQDIKRKIMQLLDKLLREGKWEGSLFLETWGKKFREMRDRFQKELGLDETTSTTTTAPASAESANKTIRFIEVYVSLYQADGMNMKKWEGILNTLGGYNLSRPVYQKETDLRDTIRGKESKQNDGYAVIQVLEDDIKPPIPNAPPLVDRAGRALFVLKEGAIKSRHILRFVHISGVYSYTNGVLIRTNAENPF